MDNRWHTLLFGRPDQRARVFGEMRDGFRDRENAPFRRFAERGDARVEAAGSMPTYMRQAARGPRTPAAVDMNRARARGVPFSAASGADLSPFGSDFGAWSDTVDAHSRRPLPDYMREQPAAEPEPPRRGLEPASGGVLEFDADMEWRAAEARARAAINLSAGHPTVAESLFGLIFGNPGGETTAERRTRELREDVERRRTNY